MFGQLSPAERSILVALRMFRDSESALTRLSYGAIMRYSGVRSRANVSAALAHLQRLHAIKISRGARIGLVRECSAYRVTLDDPKFLAACDEIFRASRQEIAAEREYRKRIRSARQGLTGDSRPKTRPRLDIPSSQGGISGCLEPTPTAGASCEGLNLSSHGELMSNLSVPIGNLEINSSAWRKQDGPGATV